MSSGDWKTIITRCKTGFYQEIAYDYDDIVSDDVDNPYVSEKETVLTHEELKDFLYDNHLLVLDGQAEGYPDQRYWPGDKEEVSQ